MHLKEHKKSGTVWKFQIEIQTDSKVQNGIWFI